VRIQPFETFRSAVPIHPTVSELIPTKLQDLSARPGRGLG
jgi:hypothetical protein